MKRYLPLLYIILLLGILAFMGTAWYLKANPQQLSQEKIQEATQVSPRPIRTILGSEFTNPTGTISPTNQVVTLIETNLPINQTASSVTITPTRETNPAFFTATTEAIDTGQITPTSPSSLNPTATSTATSVVVSGFDKIAFISDRGGNSDIFVMNSDGSGQVNLTRSSEKESNFAWSPLGDRLAYSADMGNNFEIFLIEADGTGKTRLTNNGGKDDTPDWSPLGTQVVYYSVDDGTYDLYTLNVDNLNLKQITDNDHVDVFPVWSPDSSRIAFSSSRNENWEVYAINPNGNTETNLSRSPALDFDPAWSPDGNQVAFQSTRDGNYEIYIVDADGTGLRRLTENPAYDTNPIWSPDGEQLLITSDITATDTNPSPSSVSNWEIIVVNVDGSGWRNLTNHQASDREPSWSPDGKKIAFSSDRDGNWEIYVMNSDGSRLTRLTDNASLDRYPLWQP